jgi:uncharacterized protein
MKNDFDIRHLHVTAFARAGEAYAGEERLTQFDRLLEESQGLGAENRVQYNVRGEMRADGAGADAAWLHLSAQVALPLTCQRCLGPVDFPLAVERAFRFVATEEIAQAQDDDSEEDLLVLSQDFNVLELIEDELLMALPAVPKHEVCPESVTFEVADANFEESAAQKPNPFAVLGQLKKKSGS